MENPKIADDAQNAFLSETQDKTKTDETEDRTKNDSKVLKKNQKYKKQKEFLSILDLCHIALFAALFCVLSPIAVPMPLGVSMTLQTLIIPLAGVVLGLKKGTAATIAYILIGAVGMPVFSGYQGGFAVIAGPTGGFILSFPLMSLTAGLGAKFGTGKKNIVWLTLSITVGTVINYLCGMLWFAYVTANTLQFAFYACVFPFLPLTLVKIVLACALGITLKRALKKAKLIA